MSKPLFISILLVLVIVFAAGCGRNVDVAAYAANAASSAQPTSDAAGAETAQTPTPGSSETGTPDTGDTGGTPDAGAADTGDATPVVVGDAANGEVLFHTLYPEAGFACATCHLTDSENRLVGPGLLNIGTRAATRVEGMSAVDYIHASIVDPGAYVVDTYPDQLMPRIYADLFTEDQINDLIAYLLTLH